MANSPFTIGRSTSIIFLWNGKRVDLPTVTSFESHQIVSGDTVSPLNAKPITFNIPNGWGGSFTVVRDDVSLDNLIDTSSKAFWSAGTITNGTLYQFIIEVDGTKTTFEYTGVSITLSSAGSFQNSSAVYQTVTFVASDRIKQ